MVGCGRVGYATSGDGSPGDGGLALDGERVGMDAPAGTDASMDGSNVVPSDASTAMDSPASDGEPTPTDATDVDAEPGDCRGATVLADGPGRDVTTCGGLDDISPMCTPAGTPELFFFLTIPPGTQATMDVGTGFYFVLNDVPRDHCPFTPSLCRDTSHAYINGTSAPIDFIFAMERIGGGCGPSRVRVTFRPFP